MLEVSVLLLFCKNCQRTLKVFKISLLFDLIQSFGTHTQEIWRKNFGLKSLSEL